MISGKVFKHLGILDWSLLLVIATIFLKPNFNGIAVIILMLAWLYLVIKEGINFESNPILIGLLAFFFITVFGLVNADDFTTGIHQVERKLTFLCFPTVFLTHRNRISLSPRAMVRFFAAIVFLVCIIAHVKILQDSLSETHAIRYFFSQNYTLLAERVRFHPTYLSMYNLFAQIVIADLIVSKLAEKGKRLLILYAVVILYLIVFNIHLLSRIGIFLQLVLAVGFSIYLIKKNLVLSIAFAASLIVAFLLIANTEEYNERLITPFKNISFWDSFSDNYAYLGLQRYEMISCAVKLINLKTFLFGLGTGDTQNELFNCYVENNYLESIRMNYNVHNEYLQTLLRNGLLALIILLFIIIAAFVQGLSQSNFLLIAFISLVFVFCMTESVLSVQKGAAFFSFFTSSMVSLKRT